MRTVILGDVHLGSPLCRTVPLLRVMESVPFDRLILNGDIFDDINFRRFSRRHWAVMERIRELGAEREVIWIRGNHDGAAEVLRHLLGVPVLDEFKFPFRGEIVYVTHGDEFDDFQRSARKLRKLRDLFYGFALWFDAPRKTAIRWAQRTTSTFRRAVSKVKAKALLRAAEVGARWVVVGHTHCREVEEREGIIYMNPSSWLTHSPAFVLFDEEDPEPHLVVLAGEGQRRLVRKVKVRVATVRRSLRRMAPRRAPRNGFPG